MRKFLYIFLIVLVGGAISFNLASAADILPPNKTSPFNGQESVPRSNILPYGLVTILKWDSKSGADKGYNYRVSGGGETFEETVMETEIYLRLAYATQYQWNVRSCWSSGPFGWGRSCGDWGPLFSFTTAAAIDAPRLKYPLNNAVDVSPTPTLEWYSVSGASGYSWEIEDINGNLVDVGARTPPQVTIQEGKLELGRTYKWSVQARDSARILGPESEVWQFTVQTTPETPIVPTDTKPYLTPPLSPTSGPIGTELLISGGNFDPNYLNNTVIFNQEGFIPAGFKISVTPIDGDTTKLKVKVPSGLSNGNVGVTVFAKGMESNQLIFTIGVAPVPPPPGAGAPGAPGGPTEIRCEQGVIGTKNLKTYQADGKTVAYDGLVPCGKCVLIGGPNLVEDGNLVGVPEAKNLPCQFCHFFIMFKGIVDWVTGVLVPIIAVLMLVISGVMFFFAGANPGMLQTSKNIIKSVVWGIVIIFAAYMIVNTVLSFIGLADFSLQGFDPRKWFNFPCPIKL